MFGDTGASTGSPPAEEGGADLLAGFRRDPAIEGVFQERSCPKISLEMGRWRWLRVRQPHAGVYLIRACGRCGPAGTCRMTAAQPEQDA